MMNKLETVYDMEVAMSETTTEVKKYASHPVGTSPIQFYLPKELKKKLKLYCLENDENMSSVLIKMIENLLEETEICEGGQ